jgi:predicted amidophosphoribosyltransferase
MSDEMVPQLVTPPIGAGDVCPLCHSWRPPSMQICDSCQRTGSAVGYPVGPPSVVTLYAKPSLLRDWLTRYKGRPGDADDPFDQQSFEYAKALLGRYLLEHSDALLAEAGKVDALVVVPSSRERPPPHPLGSVVELLGVETPVVPMLKRGPGQLDYRKASVDGYEPIGSSAPMRVLLLEDVFVTGAHIFSAARAL